EARVVPVARLKDVLDVLETVAEYEVSRCFKMLPLPLELEVLIPVQEMVQAEIDGSHIQGRHLGLEVLGRFDALFDAHVWTPAGCNVDASICLRLGAWKQARKCRARLTGLARFGICRVQVEHGSAGAP